MKITRHEFKKLQREWYERLKKEGFIDIEEMPQKSNLFLQKTTVIEKRAKEEYWALIQHKVWDDRTIYKNEVDRYIFKRYAEGAHLVTIADELKARHTPRHRRTLRDIIRRYEMAWKINFYTQTQLGRRPNKKKKNRSMT